MSIRDAHRIQGLCIDGALAATPKASWGIKLSGNFRYGELGNSSRTKAAQILHVISLELSNFLLTGNGLDMIHFAAAY